MANISEFLPHVLPYVPGCPEPTALQHIRDICIDFCAYTHAWQATLDPIDVKKGERRYDVVVPPNSQLHTIISSWYDRIPVVVLNTDSMYTIPEQVATDFYGEYTGEGRPATLLYDVSSKVLAVAPAPASDIAKAIVLTAALKPTRTSLVVPNILLNEYEFAIAQGAIARIARMPRQSFTSMDTSMLAEREYISARAHARIRANKTFSRSQVSVKMRPF